MAEIAQHGSGGHPHQQRAEPFINLKTLGRAAQHVALLFMDLYFAAVLITVGLSALTGDAWWPVALANSFLHWLLLPGVLAFPVMLLLRRPAESTLAGANALAFAVLFGGLFVPHLPPAEAHGPTLRVMTYNLGMGYTNPDALAQAIRQEDVDIVALQELLAVHADLLADELAAEYPYHVSHSDLNDGIGLWSRYPIVATEVFRIPGHKFTYLHAEFAVDGRRLTVLNAHPPAPSLDERGYVINGGEGWPLLLERLDPSTPTVWMGDFNTTDQSDYHASLREAGLRDAWRGAGYGFGGTFPGRHIPFPLVRIDYVWHTDHFRAVEATIGPGAGSDHLPVVAELVWLSR